MSLTSTTGTPASRAAPKTSVVSGIGWSDSASSASSASSIDGAIAPRLGHLLPDLVQRHFGCGDPRVTHQLAFGDARGGRLENSAPSGGVISPGALVQQLRRADREHVRSDVFGQIDDDRRVRTNRSLGVATGRVTKVSNTSDVTRSMSPTSNNVCNCS